MHGNDNGDVDFVFWGASETQYYGDRGCRDVGFQAQFQEDFVDYSSPLRETDVSKKVRNESSPLSPDSHHYSSISPRSQLQVMAEGRKKLMEMVHSMPECGYELSLKDIVDEKRISEKAQEEMAIQRTSSDLKIEAQIITKQKTKKTKSFSKTGDVSRNGSTEKETFLIKMFIPTSLSFKIRSDNTRNDTVVPPRSSMELTDNRADKEWWVKRILFTKVGRKSGSSSRNSSTSRNQILNFLLGLCRYDDDMDALPSCWPIFCTKKSKSTKLKARV
ncbi:hypothetical protein NC653_019333 [Populus alba x Populus x berolinensis]|uniref:Uncharacterized protein n=1 Tax=Populus alba x Populus x berolinensis TaxID=444605 RepID=A0AAD6QIW9_9ROSI|nr:hypothetical protein NC653_019333 [Populus alba x Populus x berolinensis]